MPVISLLEVEAWDGIKSSGYAWSLKEMETNLEPMRSLQHPHTCVLYLARVYPSHYPHLYPLLLLVVPQTVSPLFFIHDLGMVVMSLDKPKEI